MVVVGCWVLVVSYWLLVAGYWLKCSNNQCLILIAMGINVQRFILRLLDGILNDTAILSATFSPSIAALTIPPA